MKPWRQGLLGAILVGTWGGYAWMFWVAAPLLRASLALLAVAFGLGAAAVFWHYRSRLTSRLFTANLAIGSIVHLMVAGLVVAGDRLWQLGVLPAVTTNGHHFLLGLLGVGAAYVMWTRARGAKDEVPVLPSAEAAVGEPPPPPSAELDHPPDWEGIAAALSHRSHTTRLRHLHTLQRLAKLLTDEDTAPAVRVEGATRALHQEVLRLAAESEAEERDADEDDALSQAAALLEWGAQKLPELAELDASDLLMGKVIADIRAMNTAVERVFVDHRQLRAIHPITRDTAHQKCDQRAQAAKAALPILQANGMRLSEELIAAHEELAAFKSVTGFQAVELDDGYVTFEGNGRREAIARAFGEALGVQIEVRVYRFDDVDTRATIQRRVRRVRQWKGMED